MVTGMSRNRLFLIIMLGWGMVFMWGTSLWASPDGKGGQESPSSYIGLAPPIKGGELEPAEAEPISDPMESWNRAMFAFNDAFYFWVFKPFATGYNAVIPEDFRVCFRNVFHNATMPVRFINNLLQLKFDGAGIELGRFLINSTVGFGGLVDAADYINLKPRNEDFGQTLGYHGVGHGFYLVWPFLGPSSARDTLGMVGDALANPINWLLPGYEWVFGASAFRYTNDQSLRLGDYEDLVKAALDPYESLKDAYVQYRKKEVGR